MGMPIIKPDNSVDNPKTQFSFFVSVAQSVICRSDNEFVTFLGIFDFVAFPGILSNSKITGK